MVKVAGLAHCMIWSYNENTLYTPKALAWRVRLLWCTSV
jgi:hypothetical protein